MILVFAYNLEFEVRRSAETVKNIDYSVSFWGSIHIFSWIKNSKQPKIVFYSCLRWNDCLKFMDTWFDTSWYTQELMALNNTTTSSWKLNLTSSLPPIPYISSISLFCWLFLGDVTQKLQLELTVGWNPLTSANCVKQNI